VGFPIGGEWCPGGYLARLLRLLRAVVSQVHYTKAIQQLFCVLIKITRQLFTKGDGRNNMERMVRLEELNGPGRKYNE